MGKKNDKRMNNGNKSGNGKNNSAYAALGSNVTVNMADLAYNEDGVYVLKGNEEVRNDLFEEICRMDAATLKRWLCKRLAGMGRKVVSGDGYIYSPGTERIMVCAHMDTVHKTLPRMIVYKDGKISSPQGIGGDDRCGVYMCLSVLEKRNVHVAFFEDEEIGCVGSGKFAKTEICRNLSNSIDYVIEFDRKGNRDAVYYDLDNVEFEKFVSSTGFFRTAYGSFTDICEVCPVIGVAGVNLSCGYYNPHTTEEYVVLSEMEKAIAESLRLIETEATHFEYVEKVRSKYSLFDYGFYGFDYGDDYNEWAANEFCSTYLVVYVDENGEENSEDIFAISQMEALGYFVEGHPTLTFGSVLAVYRN